MRQNLRKHLISRWNATQGSNTFWFVWGGLLLLLFGGLVGLSPRFAYERPNITKPIEWQVALQVAAGGVYLLAVCRLKRQPDWPRFLLGWMLGLGLLFRGGFFLSTPMLEDDYYRYLWDGGVTAHGFNPYAHAPIYAQDKKDIPEFARLARDAGTVLDRVNHPGLRTIYPPIAQAAFTLAHGIRPWSLNAWRLVLLLFEGGGLLVLMKLLRQCGLARSWSLVYWWNPIVIVQLYNVAHMDGLVLPFVIGAFTLALGGKFVLASGVLGFGVGVKVWPLILLPGLLRPLFRHPGRLLAALGTFGAVTLLLLWPVYLGGLDRDSGFNVYTRYWEMNDALFMGILWGVQGILKVFGGNLEWAQLTTRAIVIAALGAWILRLHWRAADSGIEQMQRALWTVAFLFLLSPTQFPWYYVWLVPFLCFQPRFSLLLLSALLPLYYLRFYLAARGQVVLFDYGVVWVEYVPVWLALGVEVWRGRKTKGEHEFSRYLE